MKPIITKEHLLSEINRLAEKLKGKPPGQGIFEEETGLPSSAWKGRYWSKWSEALAEAGHTPNLLSQRIDDQFIYEKLATICRHYKKRPTSAEMLLFRRTVDSDFPYLAIKSRIGIRETWASFRQWVQNQPDDRQDLLDYLSDIEAIEAIEDRRQSESSVLSGGFVYLLKSGEHYKIGKSEDIERRIKEIRTQMPESLKLVHTIKTDDTSGIEQYWHRRFQSQRLNGEWFKLSRTDVAAFKKRKFQ